ncbi:MAG: HAD hydrolase-like protein, partial [Dorea sp.]|nr:HAD hydrolase-like protein [Dorea sp.]
MMKACIFDLDGTLTDTLESLAYSVGETLKEMGLSPITSDECRRFVGNGARALMEKALKAAGETDGSRLDEGMEVYGRIFDANCTYHVTPYEGIREML